MNPKFRIGLISLMVLASTGVSVKLYLDARSEFRRKDQIARQQLPELARLAAETSRLSNAVAHARSAPAISSDEFSELLKLRSEIGRLEEAALEAERLRTTNRQLAADLAVPAAQKPRDPPPDPSRVIATWPKDQLGFAGYAGPQAALKTALWAMCNGDAKTMIDSVAPELRAAMEENPNQDLKGDMTAMAQSMAPSTAFLIVGEKRISDSHVIFDIYFAGEGKTRQFAVARIGNEWKFTGK